MATKTKPQTTSTPEEAKPPQLMSVNGVSASDFCSNLDDRINKSNTFWDGADYKLTKSVKENEKLYLGKQVSDEDDGEEDNLALDNRIFSSVRTVVPYVTTRVTEPEIYPSSNSVEAKKFGEDFEKALHIKADKENTKKKLKFSLEDAIIRRRGYLKPRYDAVTKNFCSVEYVPCESIIMDDKARPGDEPRYFRHCLEKSIEDLLTMFPDSAAAIKLAFKIDNNSSLAKYQEIQTINEDWAFVPDEKEGLDLIVNWNYKKVPFGMIHDPNWRYGKDNFLDQHMMPLVFINVLSDGRSYIDKTTFVEQSKYSQMTIDNRSTQIGKNASLGSVGMPVVNSAALADDQAQYVTYDEDTVLELDVANAGVQSVNDVFTTWKAGALPADVYNDKTDAIAAVQNAFGASAINQGNQTTNNTLGQDELLRDQSMGRQQEIVDAIDVAMQRLYLLMAQMLLVYGEEDEMFRYVGENSEFDYVVMNTTQLDTKCEIRVKSGTSMPVDNPQRRATANAAAQIQMIDPLTYWEIMDEPNAQKYAKRLVDYTTNPPSFLSDINDEVFDRNAYTDIQYLKQGKVPKYRDELDKAYFDYLNKYVLSGDLENPTISLAIRQTISTFINTQLQRGQKMLGMAATQLPSAQDINQHNQQVDEANAAPQPAQPPMPLQPTPQGSPADQGQPPVGQIAQ